MTGGSSGRYEVAIIGPGRVGSLLARALPAAGHRLVAVVGGSPASQERLSRSVAGVRFCSPDEATERARLLVVTTPDAAVGEVVRSLVRDDLVGEGHRVVHLAGSLGLDALEPAALAGAGVAAIHPAQTVPSDASTDALVGAAWAVTAREADRGWARALVADLGGEPHDVEDGDRVLYHAALVLGSNAVAAAASTARQLLLSIGIEDVTPFLGPLASRSVANALASGASALTGPVVRGDAATVRAHLDALADTPPSIVEAYRQLQLAVLEQARLGMDDDVVAALRELLGP